MVTNHFPAPSHLGLLLPASEISVKGITTFLNALFSKQLKIYTTRNLGMPLFLIWATRKLL